MSSHLPQSRTFLIIFWLCIVLVFPALLINLGLLALIDDEAIRALVALEMKLSGNYLTPTLLGEFYYNKPPLYNWLLLLFFNTTGVINEWTARVPTVVFLLAYAATVFHYFKRHFDVRTGFLTAFALITCGRIFFYDSMLGLIDICFSWVIFSLFMAIFHQHKKGNYWQLFVISYLLTAVAFLLKGLPALVFQALTLGGFLIWKREWKRLFSVQHLVGGLLFLVIVGGYYWLYSLQNGLDTVFSKLFTESSKRTVVNYGWTKTVLHLFTFPFEMVYHFLPWMVLVVYLFKKGALKLVFENEFLSFCAFAFLVNIPVYWSSVEVYPRYLLMFLPLTFGIFFFLHFHFNSQGNSWQKRIVETLFLVMVVGVTALSFAPLFLEQTKNAPFLWLKTLSVSLPMFVVAWFFLRKAEWRLESFVVFLFFFRIGFDFFVLPDRNANDRGDLVRKTSVELGESTRDRPLFVYENTEIEPANGFYLTNARQKIVPREQENFQHGAWYISEVGLYPDSLFTKVGEITCRHRQPKVRDVVSLLTSPQKQ